MNSFKLNVRRAKPDVCRQLTSVSRFKLNSRKAIQHSNELLQSLCAEGEVQRVCMCVSTVIFDSEIKFNSFQTYWHWNELLQTQCAEGEARRVYRQLYPTLNSNLIYFKLLDIETNFLKLNVPERSPTLVSTVDFKTCIRAFLDKIVCTLG